MFANKNLNKLVFYEGAWAAYAAVGVIRKS